MGHPLLFPFYNFGEKFTKKSPDGNLTKEIVLYFGHGIFLQTTTHTFSRSKYYLYSMRQLLFVLNVPTDVPTIGFCVKF